MIKEHKKPTVSIAKEENIAKVDHTTRMFSGSLVSAMNYRIGDN